jgi:hypothetical protein
MAKNEKPAATAAEKKDADKAPPGGYRGVARLRKALGLSIGVPVETLCDDAAAEIEGLRLKTVGRRP